MSREESDEVPPPRSPLSTTAVRKPRSAASRAIPAPVIPPPMTRTSTGSAAIDASAAARVRCEKGVALVPNVAREVSLLPQFPKEIPAYSLNRACASSGQAVANAYDEIMLGDADVVLAGGVESLSDIPILASRWLADILVEASKAKSLGSRLRTLSRIRPRDLIPVSPAIAEPDRRVGKECRAGVARRH